MTGPGPNGAAAPIPRWRPEPDARRRRRRPRRHRSAHPPVACRPRRHACARASSTRRCIAAPPCCIPAWPSAAAAGAHRLEQKLIYGVMGTPTHWPLEDVIAEIEGGTHCQIVSSGLAAITTPLLAYPEGGRPSADARFGLRPGAQLLRRHAAALSASKRPITTPASTPPALPRCFAPRPRCCSPKAPAATRSRCRTSPPSPRWPMRAAPRC